MRSAHAPQLAHAPRTYNLGPVDRIPLGEGRSFAIEGRIVAVFRTRAGAVYATQGECPHKKGPLADGIVAGTRVVCPLHAQAFDLATGAPVGPVAHACSVLRTYALSFNSEGELLLEWT